MRRAVEVLELKHGNRPDDGHRVTVSLGVALSPAAGSTDPEAVVALADLALYRAKAEGRNCTRLFTSEPEPTSTMAA